MQRRDETRSGGHWRRPALALVILHALTFLPFAAPATSLAADATLDVESRKFGHLFYDDEDKTFTVRVSAGSQLLRGALVVHVFDAYGDLALTDDRDVALGAGETAQHQIRLATALRGLFWVSAEVRAPDGHVALERIATVAVVPRPPTPGFDAESVVGYYFFPAPGDVVRADEIAQQFQDIGVKWVRLNYDWTDPRPYRPDTSSPAWLNTRVYERWVDVLRAHGIQVMCQIVGVARWASSRPNETGPNEYGYGPIWDRVMPRDLADWNLFVRTLARRLRGRVDYFELQNEPDGRIFWMGTPDEYATLAAVTSRALKAENPAARLVVNFGNEDGRDFPDALFTRAASEVDVFGYHYQDGDWVDEVRRDLAIRGLVKPFWNTESYGDTTTWDGTDRMFSHWLRQRAAGAERSFHFVYNMHWDDSSPNFIARFGRYPVNPDYSLREHGIALRTVSDLIGRAPFLFRFAPDRNGEMEAFAFDVGGATPVIALLRGDEPAWTSEPAQEVVIRLPRGYRTLTVVDLMGNEQVVHAFRGRRVRIPLHGNPVFVTGLRTSDVRKLRVLAVARSTPPPPR